MFEEPDYQWLDPAWRRSAEAWIHEAGARQGIPVVGPISGVRFLPWSAVLRATTTGGDVYFKACGPSQRHEPALAAFLAEARPDCMIPVLAADLDRGWLLMPDGGPTLTAAIIAPADGPDHWRRVLGLLSSVQREMIGHADRLPALGVPDRRPAVLPALLADLLERPERLLTGAPGALTTADLAKLRAFRPAFNDLCAELVTIGPPDTYVHDDLHEDHVFARRLPDGDWRYTFFDYGDACVAHPFTQLVSQPRFAAQRFARGVDPVLKSLHEDYLRHWADFAPLPALRRGLSIALALGGVIRALTWVNACGDHLDEIPAFLRDAYGERVAFWLMQVVERAEMPEGR